MLKRRPGYSADEGGVCVGLKPPRATPAGHYVRVGEGQESYWAFVPNPLPPRLALDVELLGAMSGADRAIGQLAGLSGMLPNPHLLVGPFVRREAVLSSRIEGTEADMEDLYEYEAEPEGEVGEGGSAPPGDVREVLNYVRALESGLRRLADIPLSLRLIRELHQHLMAGVRGGGAAPGEFRQIQNWIGPPGCRPSEARFVPPPVPQMSEALAHFEEYLHSDDDLPPLVRIALIHYQFEAIHPFLDGNGRIGRLLIALLLVVWDILPLPLLYLSAYFERRRQEYYDLLLEVSQQGAWSRWLKFFLCGVAEQSMLAIRQARHLQQLQEEYRRRVMRAGRSVLLVRLADELFRTPVVTVRKVERLLNVGNRTARYNVERLVALGILSEGADKYRRKYYAGEILRTVTSPRFES